MGMATLSTALTNCHIDWVGFQETGIGNKCPSLIHYQCGGTRINVMAPFSLKQVDGS